jgi:uncharacterized protein (TIGR02687 family)
MSSPHILRNLERLFGQHRIVFWYDPKDEWSNELDELELPEVEKVRVIHNEIGTKFRILRDEPKQPFLLYIAGARPNDENNWLLDVLLSHTEFHADRASLHLQETGLPPEFRELAEEHAKFFAVKERREALKNALESTKDDETHRSLRRRMMAIVLKAQDHSLDNILMELCKRLNGAELIDPVADALNEFALLPAFWDEVERQYGYRSPSPTLLDFVLCLFQNNAPLGGDIQQRLQSQAIVFLSRWKDSARFRDCYENLSGRTADSLHAATALSQMEDRDIQQLVEQEVDAYEIIEKHIVAWFRDGVKERRWRRDERQDLLDHRSRSFWYKAYQSMYEAIQHGADLLDLVDGCTFDVDDLDQGINRYCSAWWRIDQAYRKFHASRRASRQASLLQDIEDEVERRYLHDYLAPLATRWETLLDAQKVWPPRLQDASSGFFEEVVRPVISKQKLVVIISDGLRYECGAELYKQILKEDRFTAELKSRLAPLPSYTQLGMASLLPHKTLEMTEDNKLVKADGKPTAGSDNREKILNQDPEIRAKVLRAEDFMNLNTKSEGRPLLKEHDILYVYHNEIDKVGDDLKTEESTASACEDALDTILNLVKKATNINASNILITADHGFLFRQCAVEDADCVDAPKQGLTGTPNRRFVTGRGLESSSILRAFHVRDLGLEGDFEVGITKGLQRLRVKGSGKRFVHGGAMPQEVIVPVLFINKARTSNTKKVEVEIQNFPARITTTQVAVRLYQKQVVSDEDKVLGRELEVGIYGKGNVLLSDLKTLNFDSRDTEPRNREEVVTLTLGHSVNDFNNQELELRLSERIGNTSHQTPYQIATGQYIKPFETDIDEF